MEGVLVVGGGARTLSEHCQGTREQGTETHKCLYAVGPWRWTGDSWAGVDLPLPLVYPPSDPKGDKVEEVETGDKSDSSRQEWEATWPSYRMDVAVLDLRGCPPVEGGWGDLPRIAVSLAGILRSPHSHKSKELSFLLRGPQSPRVDSDPGTEPWRFHVVSRCCREAFWCPHILWRGGGLDDIEDTGEVLNTILIALPAITTWASDKWM